VYSLLKAKQEVELCRASSSDALRQLWLWDSLLSRSLDEMKIPLLGHSRIQTTFLAVNYV
jgi:hypothetical protein